MIVELKPSQTRYRLRTYSGSVVMRYIHAPIHLISPTVWILITHLEVASAERCR
jgi:hypothetical protein